MRAGETDEVGHFVRRRIEPRQSRSEDEIAIQRAQADVRLAALRHAAGEGLLFHARNEVDPKIWTAGKVGPAP